MSIAFVEDICVAGSTFSKYDQEVQVCVLVFVYDLVCSLSVPLSTHLGFFSISRGMPKSFCTRFVFPLFFSKNEMAESEVYTTCSGTKPRGGRVCVKGCCVACG